MKNVKSSVILKKSWGQNLLVDRPVLEFMAGFIRNVSYTNCVVEFAAGTGNLTEYLINSGLYVFAVEMERDIIKILDSRFGNQSSLKILNMNMMDFPFEEYSRKYGRMTITGNLPYNLSKLFLFKVFENAPYIKDAVLMFQYEVAIRLVASCGDRDWSVMSVFSSLLSEANIIKIINPNAFFPPPKVRSALVHFKFYDDINDKYVLYKQINKVVQEIFKYPRKNLRNIIRSRFGDEKLVSIGRMVDLNKRPQNLTLDDIRSICNEIL